MPDIRANVVRMLEQSRVKRPVEETASGEQEPDWESLSPFELIEAGKGLEDREDTEQSVAPEPPGEYVEPGQASEPAPQPDSEKPELDPETATPSVPQPQKARPHIHYELPNKTITIRGVKEVEKLNVEIEEAKKQQGK